MALWELRSFSIAFPFRRISGWGYSNGRVANGGKGEWGECLQSTIDY